VKNKKNHLENGKSVFSYVTHYFELNFGKYKIFAGHTTLGGGGLGKFVFKNDVISNETKSEVKTSSNYPP